MLHAPRLPLRKRPNATATKQRLRPFPVAICWSVARLDHRDRPATAAGLPPDRPELESIVPISWENAAVARRSSTSRGLDVSAVSRGCSCFLAGTLWGNVPAPSWDPTPRPTTNLGLAPTTPNRQLPPALRRVPKVEAAKWPPDDDALPPGGGLPGAPSYSGGGGDDGNFKRGRFAPAAIIVGILAVGGIAAAIVFGSIKDSEKMDPKRVAIEKKELALLPIDEALPKYRQWAAQDDELKLKEEGFTQLAWAKDRRGIPIITKGLASVDHARPRNGGEGAPRVRHRPRPTPRSPRSSRRSARRPRPTSRRSPGRSWRSTRPGPSTTSWTSTGRQARDRSAPRRLPGVRRGGARGAGLARQDRDARRRRERQRPPARRDDALEQRGPEVDRRRSSSSSRTSRSRSRARPPSASARSATTRRRSRSSTRSRRPTRPRARSSSRRCATASAATGLVLALKTVQTRPSARREKFQTKQLFDMMKELEDPRGGDALYAYIQTQPQAALEVRGGDAPGRDRRRPRGRGARLAHAAGPAQALQRRRLARAPPRRQRARRTRRACSPTSPSSTPRSATTSAQQAEPGVLFWVDPETSRSRTRTACASWRRPGRRRRSRMLEKWADPRCRCPKEGAQPPSRRTGRRRRARCATSAGRRTRTRLADPREAAPPAPHKLDVSWDSLLQGGLTILGMTPARARRRRVRRLRAVGRPEGLRRPREVRRGPDGERAGAHGGVLRALVGRDRRPDEGRREEGPRQHDKTGPEGRLHAHLLPRDAHPPSGARRDGGRSSTCSRQRADMEVRHQVARAIGMGGITPNMVQPAFEKLKDVNAQGRRGARAHPRRRRRHARRAPSRRTTTVDPARRIEELKDVYNKTFGYWSDRNYENGDIARWVDERPGRLAREGATHRRTGRASSSGATSSGHRVSTTARTR